MPAKKSELQYLLKTEMTALNQQDDAARASDSGVTVEVFVGCTAADTSLVVDSATSLHKGQVITLDKEDMLITSISGTTVNVTRGTNNTVAKRHADNTKVYSKIWTDTNVSGTTTSAILQMEIKDVHLNARTMFATLYNQSTDPFNGTASNAKCQFTGVFTDFMPVRVRESETKEILFYGLIYDVKEKYERDHGPLVIIECRDALAILSNAKTLGAAGYKIDASGTTTDVVVIGTSTLDADTNLYNQTISSRSGLIRSLIAQFTPEHVKSPITSNIHTSIARSGYTLNPVFETAGRYTESAQNFNNDGKYRLGKGSSKPVLKHIMNLAATEPHLAAGSSNTQTYGYDFYLSPVFTDVLSTNEKPLPFLDYFRRATRPNSSIASTPAYGLSARLQTGTLTQTGQVHFMTEFDSDEDKAEVFTKAIVKYKESATVNEGLETTVEGVSTMELFELESWHRPEDFVCTPNETADTAALKSHINISGGSPAGTNDDNAAEWLQVRIGNISQWATVGRIQWLNRTDFLPNTDTTGSGVIPSANPVYALISDIQPHLDPKFFQEGTLYRSVPIEKATLAFSNYVVRTRMADGEDLAGHSGDTSFAVEDAAIFSVGGVIQIANELMTITAISTNTLTVDRDTPSSGDIAAHDSNAEVTCEVKLTEAIDDTTGIAWNINVPAAPNLGINAVIKIDSEYIRLTNVDEDLQNGGAEIVGTRGWDSSTAATHADGANIQVAIPNDRHQKFDVAGGHSLAVNDKIRINDEEMQVTAVATNTITVTRGIQTYLDPGDTQHTAYSHGTFSLGRLNEALDNSETDITLDFTDMDGAYGYIGFYPLHGNINPGGVISIGSEDMHVTANNTGTDVLTVQRGYNSTTAQVHADDSTVYVKGSPHHGNVDHGATLPKVYNAYPFFTIKNRLGKALDGVENPNIVTPNSKEPRAIREHVASTLLTNNTGTQKRITFETVEKPGYYFDKSPDSVTSTTTNSIVHQTVTFNSFNLKDYGFHTGMTAVKLDSSGNPTTTYGYAFNVYVSSGNAVFTVIWNTGTISASDTVRFYVPVRAGDVIYLRNDLVNTEGRYLVTKTVYKEQNGVSSTKYDVVEAGDDFTGAFAKNVSPNLAKKSDVLDKSDLSELSASVKRSSAITTQVFSLTNDGTTSKADQVDWAAGNLVYDGRKRSIDAGTTASTMVGSAAGNTGQSGTTLAVGVDYVVYYPGTGTAYKTIKKSAYRNVEDDDDLIVATCRYNTDAAMYNVLINKENGGGVGDGPFNVTANRMSRGAQDHSHTSSIRYKDDVVPLDIDTSKIFDLSPKSFTWKDEDSPNFGPDYGLIAEEVNEVFPELVRHNIKGRRSYATPGENTEPQGVKYDALTVMLMEEVRKLKKRIDDLES